MGVQDIRFECPHCGTRIRVKPSAAGKRLRCTDPDCAKAITVPMSLDDDVDAAPAAPAVPAPRPQPAARAAGGPRRNPGLMLLFYLWVLCPVATVFLVVVVNAAMLSFDGKKLPMVIRYAAGAFMLFPSLCQPVLFLVLLYRLWGQVQDGEARATPSQAVLFLLVPVFNVYWLYVSTVGLAKELNRVLADRDVDAAPASVELMEANFALPFMLYTVVAVLFLLGFETAAAVGLAVSALVQLGVGAGAFYSAARVGTALARAD